MSIKASGVTIPLFPCKSIPEQLEFYRSLGFEVTYEQTRPNGYACVRHAITEIHFFAWKPHIPDESLHGCYIIVPDADAVYAEFRGNLKRVRGKVPSRGLPRISASVNNTKEDRRFNITDPAGNTLTIGQPVRNAKTDELQKEPATAFERAYQLAYTLAYSKEDIAGASKVLENVLRQGGATTELQTFKALALRADLAHLRDDLPLAAQYVADLHALALDIDVHRDELEEELRKLEELKEKLDELQN